MLNHMNKFIFIFIHLFSIDLFAAKYFDLENVNSLWYKVSISKEGQYYDYSELSKSLKDNQLIIRVWDKDCTKYSPGHIELETKKYFLSVYPYDHHKSAIKIIRNYYILTPRDSFKKFAKGEFPAYHLKVIELSPSEIDAMNKEMERIGCVEKSSKRILEGSKNYFDVNSRINVHDDKEFGNCLTCVFQVLKKANIVEGNSLIQSGKYFAGFTAASIVSCSLPEMIASTAIVSSSVASGIGVGIGLCIAGKTLLDSCNDALPVRQGILPSEHYTPLQVYHNVKFKSQKILFEISDNEDYASEQIKIKELEKFIIENSRS